MRLEVLACFPRFVPDRLCASCAPTTIRTRTPPGIGIGIGIGVAIGISIAIEVGIDIAIGTMVHDFRHGHAPRERARFTSNASRLTLHGSRLTSHVDANVNGSRSTTIATWFAVRHAHPFTRTRTLSPARATEPELARRFLKDREKWNVKTLTCAFHVARQR